jgi:hypothetical protein
MFEKFLKWCEKVGVARAQAELRRNGYSIEMIQKSIEKGKR